MRSKTVAVDIVAIVTISIESVRISAGARNEERRSQSKVCEPCDLSRSTAVIHTNRSGQSTRGASLDVRNEKGIDRGPEIAL